MSGSSKMDAADGKINRCTYLPWVWMDLFLPDCRGWKCARKIEKSSSLGGKASQSSRPRCQHIPNFPFSVVIIFEAKRAEELIPDGLGREGWEIQMPIGRWEGGFLLSFVLLVQLHSMLASRAADTNRQRDRHTEKSPSCINECS